VPLTRLDMRNESTQQFLSRQAAKYQRHFAVKNGRLLFIDPPAIGTLTIDLTNSTIVKAAEFDISPRKAYAKASINYYDSQQKKLITHIQRSTQPGERTLTLYDQPSSLADAIKIADAALSQANQKAGGNGAMTVIGQPVDAGMIVRLTNGGKLPVDWRVDKVVTTIKPGAGWTSRLQLSIKR
jgi:phage protein D